MSGFVTTVSALSSFAVIFGVLMLVFKRTRDRGKLLLLFGLIGLVLSSAAFSLQTGVAIGELANDGRSPKPTVFGALANSALIIGLLLLFYKQFRRLGKYITIFGLVAVIGYAAFGAFQYEPDTDKLMWVNSDHLNRRACGSVACGVVGKFTKREIVHVRETKNGWARVTPYIDANCKNGENTKVISGNKDCSIENGIENGRFAEWVSIQYLSKKTEVDKTSAQVSKGKERKSKSKKKQSIELPRFVRRNQTTNFKHIAMMDESLKAIKVRLRDSGSAKFKDVYLNSDSSGIIVTCGEVNSKNAFGGYAGFQRFIASPAGNIAVLDSDMQLNEFQKVWNQLCM